MVNVLNIILAFFNDAGSPDGAELAVGNLFSFVCVFGFLKVIILSSFPLLCTQLVLLGGVFVSPMFCSSFTQQLQTP